MSSSFITKDQLKGFWADDSISQVVCWGLVNSIDSTPDNKFSLLKPQLREHLYDCSQGVFIGFTNFRFQNYLVTPEHFNQMRLCIYDTEILFKSKGQFISTDELNRFQKIQETKVIWSNPLSVQILVKYLLYLRWVIDDSIPWTEEDSITYWDFSQMGNE